MMVTRFLKSSAAMILGIAAASSVAVAQSVADVSPKITSISKITTAKLQTITITGTGFGTHKPYTGVSRFISFSDDTKHWEAGNAVDGDRVTLIVHSWTNTKITLGGFAGQWGANNWTLAVGNKETISIWNAQGGGGGYNSCFAPSCSRKAVTVVAAATNTELRSSPNPSYGGLPVTFTAVVTSSAGPPPDGGKVQFMKGDKILAVGTLHDGVATFRTSKLEFGENEIRAVYVGDVEFAGTDRDEKSAVETHIVN
jgi:hypothetical protein